MSKSESTANATDKGTVVNPVLSALRTAYRMLCDLREGKRDAEKIEPSDAEKREHRKNVKSLTLSPEYAALVKKAAEKGISVVLTYRTQTIGSRFYADLIKNSLEFTAATAATSNALGADLFTQVHDAKPASVKTASGATVPLELVPESLDVANEIMKEFSTKDLRSSIKG